MGSIVILFILAIYGGILFLVFGGMWKTFTKAGQPGWACLVPIYNFLVMADIARVSRNQVWKAMVTGILGGVVYMGTIFQTIMNGEEPSGMMFTIGLLVYLVALVLTLVFLFPIYKGIALNFGQSVGFAWGLMLLNIVFFPILGFGSARYQGGSYLNDDLLDSGL
jgi:hypothetical protein